MRPLEENRPDTIAFTPGPVLIYCKSVWSTENLPRRPA